MKHLKKYKDLLIVGLILITYIFALININYFTNTATKFLSLLTPFVYGFIIAYLLNPLSNAFKKIKLINMIKREKLKIGISIFLSYLVLCLFLTLFFLFIIPDFWISLNDLVKNLPSLAQSLQEWITKHIPENIKFFNNEINLSEMIKVNLSSILSSLLENSANYATTAISITKSVTNTIVNIGLGLIISLYMLLQKDTFSRQSKKILFAYLPKEKSKQIIGLCSQLHRQISNFISAKLIDSFIIGILCYIGVLCIGTKHYLAIASIIGITNIIPYFGPFLGAIPCVIIVLAESPVKAMIFTVFILALQQFDGNILGPKLMGNSMGLSAFWIIFAVVIMTGLLGFTGMLIGVPIFAVIYTLIQANINNRLMKNEKTEKDMPEN